MIAVVIPTYNEAQNIRLVLLTLNKILPVGSMIIVVDDSSPDGTSKIVEEVAPGANIFLLRRPRKMGLGTALRDGIKFALSYSPQFIVTMDSDFSHDLVTVKNLIRQRTVNPETLIVGSRYVPQGRNGSPWVRHLISRGGNHIMSKIFNLNCRDATSGLRLYPVSFLRKIDLTKITSVGYAFQWEILHMLNQHKMQIKEIPINFEPRQLGRSKFTLKEIAGYLALLPRLLRD